MIIILVPIIIFIGFIFDRYITPELIRLIYWILIGTVIYLLGAIQEINQYIDGGE